MGSTQNDYTRQSTCDACTSNIYPSIPRNFSKVTELPKSGLIIYVHKKKEEKGVVSPTHVKTSSDTYFVLHNTSQRDLTKTDYAAELWGCKTKCCICKELISRIRNLLLDISHIRKNDIIGVCANCRRSPYINCKRCQYIVSKFLAEKAMNSGSDQEVLCDHLVRTKLNRLLDALGAGENINMDTLSRYGTCLKDLNQIVKLLEGASNFASRKSDSSVKRYGRYVFDSVAAKKEALQNLLNKLKTERSQEVLDVYDNSGRLTKYLSSGNSETIGSAGIKKSKKYSGSSKDGSVSTDSEENYKDFKEYKIRDKSPAPESWKDRKESNRGKEPKTGKSSERAWDIEDEKSERHSKYYKYSPSSKERRTESGDKRRESISRSKEKDVKVTEDEANRIKQKRKVGHDKEDTEFYQRSKGPAKSDNTDDLRKPHARAKVKSSKSKVEKEEFDSKEHGKTRKTRDKKKQVALTGRSKSGSESEDDEILNRRTKVKKGTSKGRKRKPSGSLDNVTKQPGKSAVKLESVIDKTEDAGRKGRLRSSGERKKGKRGVSTGSESDENEQHRRISGKSEMSKDKREDSGVKKRGKSPDKDRNEKNVPGVKGRRGSDSESGDKRREKKAGKMKIALKSSSSEYDDGVMSHGTTPKVGRKRDKMSKIAIKISQMKGKQLDNGSDDTTTRKHKGRKEDEFYSKTEIKGRRKYLETYASQSKHDRLKGKSGENITKKGKQRSQSGDIARKKYVRNYDRSGTDLEFHIKPGGGASRSKKFQFDVSMDDSKYHLHKKMSGNLMRMLIAKRKKETADKGEKKLKSESKVAMPTVKVQSEVIDAIQTDSISDIFGSDTNVTESEHYVPHMVQLESIMIRGTKIARYREEEKFKDVVPELFKKKYEFEDIRKLHEAVSSVDVPIDQKKGRSGKISTDGVIRYMLSDRRFIENGWTILPETKVLRKANIFRMTEVDPEKNWFVRHLKNGNIKYDTGELFSHVTDKGSGNWFYRNGRVALTYKRIEAPKSEQRYTVYSSGDRDENGRTRPVAALACFDYRGNGIVYDHYGNIRLKYTQTEGVICDEKIGPLGRWKWNLLNEPPDLHTVIADPAVQYEDVHKLIKSNKEPKSRPSNFSEDRMLAIEYNHIARSLERDLKYCQRQPFQIRAKVFKINEFFSLRIIDQEHVFLTFNDGLTSAKVNVGMKLHLETAGDVVDVEDLEMQPVHTPYERVASSDSMAAIQRSIQKAKQVQKEYQNLPSSKFQMVPEKDESNVLSRKLPTIGPDNHCRCACKQCAAMRHVYIYYD